MRAPSVKVLVLALVAATAGCTSGPCNDFAQMLDAARERSLGCPGASELWDAVLLDRAVELCAEAADRYCTPGDVDAVASARACVEEIKACAGGDEAEDAFKESIESCFDKVEGDAVSNDCQKALLGML